MRKLRLSKIKELTQAYPARKWWNCSLNLSICSKISSLDPPATQRCGGLRSCDSLQAKEGWRRSADSYQWELLRPWWWWVSCSVVSDSLQPHWTVARQALLSTGFPRQEYWSRLSFPSPILYLHHCKCMSDPVTLYPRQHLVLWLFFHSDRHVVTSHCGFNLQFSDG